MTVQERTHAICESCEQGYSVPDANRTYTCKKCNGTVRVPGEGMGTDGHLEGAVDCSKCHAINHIDVERCVECGSDLGDSEEWDSEAELLEARREATRNLRHSYKWLDAYRWLCRLGAIGYTLVTVVAVVALSRIDIPLEAGVLVVALCSLLTILMLMGAVQFIFRPFIWTVVIATFATAVSVVHFVGPNPLGLAFGWSAFWAVVFWLGISPTLRTRRLIAAHNDLYIEQQSTARTRRQIESGDRSHRHDRLQRVLRNANRKAWRISIAIVVVAIMLSAAGTTVVLGQVRPHELSASVSKFEDAWNSSSRTKLASLFAPGVRDWQVDRLFGLAEGHGWEQALPKLGSGIESELDGAVAIEYMVQELPINLRWSLHDREWLIDQAILPIPPIAKVLERFLAAWEKSDLQVMSKFFTPDFHERMAISLDNTLKNRRWTRFPTLESTELNEVDEENVQQYLRYDGGKTRADWAISPTGEWCLQRLVFPEPKKIRRRK